MSGTCPLALVSLFCFCAFPPFRVMSLPSEPTGVIEGLLLAPLFLSCLPIRRARGGGAWLWMCVCKLRPGLRLVIAAEGQPGRPKLGIDLPAAMRAPPQISKQLLICNQMHGQAVAVALVWQHVPSAVTPCRYRWLGPNPGKGRDPELGTLGVCLPTYLHGHFRCEIPWCKDRASIYPTTP